MKKTLFTKSYQETQKLGLEIAKKVKDGGIIALYGNLGSGKTTFVQGLARGLGIKGKIISPTFIIVRKYELGIKNKELGAKNFYHIDLYRVEDEKDITGLGLDEIISDLENIVAIEWPEKIEKILSDQRINMHFEYIEGDKRKIEIE